MTDTEFRAWLEAEVQGGRMTPAQRTDLLDQKDHFDRNRTENELLFPHRIVGYADGKREVSGSVQDLLNRVQQQHPGRMVYFEPMAGDLY
jgi:hypothetical protein